MTINDRYTMSEPEIKAWLFTLGNSTADRIRTIENLLKHANGDEMSPEDRTICRKTLDRLRNGEMITPEIRVVERPRFVDEEID